MSCLKKIFFASLLLCFSASFLSCAKVYRTAKTTEPQIYKKSYQATPNQLYYALRWAFKSHGYPIAEEDLQHGILKTRYVPVKPTSHYIDVFGHKDFGVSGAYHQLEAKLIPMAGKTLVEIGSRIQAYVSPIKSSGKEEEMILEKVASYLRRPDVQLTNLGVQE